mmetsp:Transcript_39835/g.54243  ORF Transcript_39835/g.54243 Transcript_39835/m.54243 type:complete len:226 (-) Transcript_39835:104-781(-)|eukprot:CAMPEP_0185795112 /NCGR_PEP_ID=MMETSP1174-20130828/160375_1 /TAXON_ID=35687 /ORGANISM="Dictyocha speculum, Strain CCMP1381" /LENGTH=225 /DNA_ID=CAMNT_0028490387 /DNA_START=1061 /DNA_END=1738 /DNA_ORIENTATION=-
MVTSSGKKPCFAANAAYNFIRSVCMETSKFDFGSFGHWMQSLIFAGAAEAGGMGCVVDGGGIRVDPEDDGKKEDAFPPVPSNVKMSVGEFMFAAWVAARRLLTSGLTGEKSSASRITSGCKAGAFKAFLSLERRCRLSSKSLYVGSVVSSFAVRVRCNSGEDGGESSSISMALVALPVALVGCVNEALYAVVPLAAPTVLVPTNIASSSLLSSLSSSSSWLLWLD